MSEVEPCCFEVSGGGGGGGSLEGFHPADPGGGGG